MKELGVSRKFFEAYREKYKNSGYGNGWSEYLRGLVTTEWNKNTAKGRQALKHHTSNHKHPFEDPWDCYECNFNDNG